MLRVVLWVLRQDKQIPDKVNFKTWVSNAFAAQKEQSLRRSRDFDRREWSLTKSANKMLRKNGECRKRNDDDL